MVVSSSRPAANCAVNGLPFSPPRGIVAPMSIAPSDPASLTEFLQRAHAAQELWANLPLAQRLRPLEKLRARLAAEPDILGEVVGKEIGKSRYEAIAAEVLPVAECCAFLMDRAPRLLAPRREVIRGTMPFAGTGLVRHVPWGVVAVLVPWNYPLFLCAVPVLNALTCGNAAVMKASPRAKKTVAAFAEWLWAAGYPKDLVVLLDSSDDAGRAVTSSPLVNRIVFTGGSQTGRAVLAAAARNMVPATVELSGCDAVYVLKDANIKLAAESVTFGLRLNAGRTCVCPRRVFVERPVADSFIEKFSHAISSRKLLDPMDPQTLREADVLAAKLNGAPNTRSLNGRAHGDAEKALAYQGGTEALAITQGNFVPAVVVTPVDDVEEAVRLDLSSPYGLGASVFTNNSQAALDVTRRMRAGIIAINDCVVQAAEAALPFGGAGESGYGVRGGEEGLMEMTRPQSLAFLAGSYRPHHDAGEEAEQMVLALLRARHGGNVFKRLKGWMDYAIEGAKWNLRKK